MEGYEVNWPKVILFGDSLIQKSFEQDHGIWGSLLANRFQRICDIVPRGFSGYNSRYCRIIFPRIFPAKSLFDIAAFVICLGANDSNDKDSPRKQHVPVSQYKENLLFMINHLKSAGVSESKIILLAPPPYCQKAFAAFCEKVGFPSPKKSNEAVLDYENACVQLGNECNVDVIKLYSEMMKDKDWPRYLVDGLHFSCDGSFKVYELLLPYILKRTFNTMMFPKIDDIDPLNPEPYLTKPMNVI